MSGYAYYRPQTLDELFDLKAAHPDARFVAGGTDLLVQMRSRQLAPPALISLRAVEGLQHIHMGETTRVGAACPVADLIDHPDLGSRYPILTMAARRLGSPQIRSVATVGGNLANGSPCADTALALLVLDAQVVIQSRETERIVPIDAFFSGPKQTCLGPDEILTAILLAPPAPDARAIFFKKGRVKMDIATASLALLIQMAGVVCTRARVAVGSVAPVPMRLPQVEQMLAGAEISPELIARAGEAAEQAVSPITDVRATAWYRKQLVGVYLRRALEQAISEVAK